MSEKWTIDPGFDLEGFLARPLVARVACSGPSIRPVWFVWEDGCFWWLTGSWSRLPAILARDPRVALVVDTCELETGRVLQVTAVGEAAAVPFDAARARRKLARYLGPDETTWDEDRFGLKTLETGSAQFVRLAPQTLRARDLSYLIVAPEA